jgi:hypothetical protein
MSVTFLGSFPTYSAKVSGLKESQYRQKKGDCIVINQRKLTLTVYNVFCDQCGARGPDGISEVDAHLVAKQAGWELIEDSYVCPDPRHAELKKMRELLREIKVQPDPPALVSWWR